MTVSVHVVRLPDVGEGIAEAELVCWLVNIGDRVTPESALAEVLTDKANVEIVSPVTGTVAYLHGEPGEVLAVGSDFVGIELESSDATHPATSPLASGAGEPSTIDAPSEPSLSAPAEMCDAPSAASNSDVRPSERPPTPPRARAIAAPAVRQAALERGIDLRLVHGSGPRGQILHSDLDAFEAGRSAPAPHQASTATTETVLRGVRRKIAHRLEEAWRIPHITYVEEVDVTEVERLRQSLNEGAVEPQTRLTLLSFIVRAVVMACGEHPAMNSTFDEASETLTSHGSVHVGIATQTDTGLVVPVLRHADAMSLIEVASEIKRLSEAARAGRATRDELSGSTITITSLGRLGGLMTTPIINHPEVAIIGVNRIQTRPMFDGTSFLPRAVMNCSSSFDHRVVDGWDAAVFVQRIKSIIETPDVLLANES